MKKVLSMILVVLMLMSVLPSTSFVSEAASTGLSLAQLRQKFPHGKYWNHAGNPGASNSVNNQNGYTSTPCSKHGVVGTSKQTCNGFQPGSTQLSWQCMGYAEKLGYDATGYNPRNNANGWYTYTSSSALNNLKPGDIVRYKNGGHSIYVTAVSGDTVTYTDCNSDGHCIIRWGATISKSTLRSSFTHVRSAPSSPKADTCTCSSSYAGDYICNTSSAPLNIRSGHGSSYSVIGSVPKGAKVYISKATGTGSNDWGHVSYNGVSGYVSMQYMKKATPAHADAPTINWWLSDSEYGNAISDFKEGNRYYFCYKLYDSVTGKPWDQVSSNNYSVKIGIYNPDGSLNYEAKRSDDSGWISIFYKKAGTYTRKVVVSGDFTFEGSRNFTVASNPKKINSSSSSATLTFGGTTSTTIYVWTSGYYDGSAVLNWSTSNNNVSCTWGDWNSEDKLPLTITAKAVGTTTVTLSVRDKTTNAVLHSIPVTVTVKGCTTHSYTSKVTKAATCTASGTRTYTCSRCSNSYTETISATGHSWKAATCTSKRTCSTCGTTDGSALGHSYTSKVTKAATCTASGTRTYTCSRCANSYTETISATGHSWKAATCTSKRTCSTCGTTDGSALGHSYTSKVTKAATCTASGTRTYTCSRCANSYTETISATGHSWKELSYEVNKKVYACEDCGESYTENLACTHSFRAVVTEPTCTEQGYTTYKCTVCGYSKKSVYLDATGHNMGQWKITEEATCDEDGRKTRRCLNCEYTQTQTVYASGHNMSSWKTVKAVTCDENGVKRRSCLNCDYVKSQTVYASGHTFSSWKTVKSATCTQNGTKKRSCSDCDYTETKAIKAYGHSYSSEFTVDRRATYKAAGSKSKHCTRDGCTSVTAVTAIARLSLKKVSGLKATPSETGIRLTWNEVKGAEGYEIYYSTDGKTWKKLTVTDNSAKLEKLQKATVYKVKVRALAGSNKGSFSSVLTASTAPGKVTVTDLRSKKAKLLTLVWKKVSGASGYEVEYSTSKKFTEKTTESEFFNSGTRKATFEKLKSGKIYYVRVRAYKAVGNAKVYGAWSTVGKLKVK